MDNNEKMTDSELMQARNAFEAICEAMDSYDLSYEKDEEDLSVHLILNGDYMPIALDFQVIPDRELIRMISPMPFTVPRERRLEMAVAVTLINPRILNGCYDLNLNTGTMYFRLIHSFSGSDASVEAIRYLISITNCTENLYNDKLIMVKQGIISLRRLVNLLNEEDRADISADDDDGSFSPIPDYSSDGGLFDDADDMADEDDDDDMDLFAPMPDFLSLDKPSYDDILEYDIDLEDIDDDDDYDDDDDEFGTFDEGDIIS